MDPAIGSAHFLTVALDMMADRMELFLAETGLPDIKKQLDELRENGCQILDDGDLLRRLILKRCIYGVDVSPMAVEIASITLWLTSFVPGLALSYLGSNLKHGNTLIGVVNPDVVRAVDGLFTGGQYVVNTMTSAAELQMRQASISDRSPAEVKRSEEMGAELRKMTDGLRLAFHVWTAEPLGLTDTRHMLGAYGQDIIENREGLDPETADTLNRAERLAKQHNIFHWPLEFPHIFNHTNPGFDVVTGNPPWNEITVEELGFYALRDPGLRGLKDRQKREERMAELDKQNPGYRAQFEEEKERLSRSKRVFLAKQGTTCFRAQETQTCTSSSVNATPICYAKAGIWAWCFPDPRSWQKAHSDSGSGCLNTPSCNGLMPSSITGDGPFLIFMPNLQFH